MTREKILDSEFLPPRREGAKFGTFDFLSFAPLREIIPNLVAARRAWSFVVDEIKVTVAG